MTRLSSDDAPAIPPIHIEETIRAIARLHAEHHASATRHQRAVDGVTSALSRPNFIVYLTGLTSAWMVGNAAVPLLGFTAIDPPPFAGLTGAVSLTALYFVVMILTTQRRDDGLGRRRELLTLELAILSEQKTAKIVALLEELRRDSPTICNRVDEQANVMARPVDPRSVIEAIQETRSEALNVARATDSAQKSP
ncbi:MAG: DUF1003 domain-containing protein [Pseudomonadota bacterium]|nr:DUF1003 domain-containing protein [Pseudomonadota bacterium]